MIEHWDGVERPEQMVPDGAEPISGAVDRLLALLGPWADRFGEEWLGSRGLEFRLGARGLVADEAASFLRSLDAGLVEVDDMGGVRVRACRAKATGGRYSLFSANRYGGTPYVSLNTEYLIQIGAACELVAFHSWSSDDVEIEVGEFDAIAHADGRVVLAMEAKARIDGSDSLRGLWVALRQYAADDHPPEPRTNHSRKYVELLRLAEAGPMALWLVAAQARWFVRVERREGGLSLDPMPALCAPDRGVVLDMVGHGAGPDA